MYSLTRAAFAVEILPAGVEQVAVAGLQQLQENGAGFLVGRGHDAPGA